MHVIDYSLIAAYLALLLWLGLRYRVEGGSGARDMIVGGRMLTLPAFVASLVSTWYGGILGVGEYSYNYGLSNWLVFGLPYYLAAALFAIFLARKARQTELLTIPQRLGQVYNSRTAMAGAVTVFFMTVPSAYILMLGVLCQFLFGWPAWAGILGGTLFSIVYVFTGGFKSIVRTDVLQFGLMFVGFGGLLGMLLAEYGGLDFLVASLPQTHLTWHGGNSGWYIAVWYVIALATMIEPAFYQRCYAARSPRTARRGIFISIGCWCLFDFMTTTCGLYARALLPELADPVGAYPALAQAVLPVGLMGLFALALLATVMSTVDSYSFLAASTWGHDVVPRLRKLDDQGIVRQTRIGLLLSSGLAVVLALFFRSVVDIWHALGSIGTPALLVPLFTAFVGNRRLPPRVAFVSIVTSSLLSLVWYLSKYMNIDGSYWCQVEPIFPGLLWSLVLFAVFSRRSPQPDLPESR
ncbi:MAG: sodium:solute symporter family protein [candidate division Zixibacteria bacterium]|nr:sodium:solute symporter family protein [candidate division Zixibacteria bacterium]MDH3937177.1 sodium:solute symporter family protein [candidate division Zixibacteria bacterium]MDH4033805.1 sodium:solute symporter family protein [candidate division Zixibacteria bacterium]